MAEKQKIESQLRKGILEYCILGVLKNEKAYASDIIRTLKKAELIVVEGTLYPLLTRMKNEGWLNYQWEESTQGPPRKYYYLTEEGQFYYNEIENYWNQLITSVNLITNNKNSHEQNI
ncbi:MAG: PadR family transcriptional regulator [Bacteroidales bacterium]|nr:PadR family transcriptional regulator [Bacteroidales bacterium]